MMRVIILAWVLCIGVRAGIAGAAPLVSENFDTGTDGAIWGAYSYEWQSPESSVSTQRLYVAEGAQSGLSMMLSAYVTDTSEWGYGAGSTPYAIANSETDLARLRVTFDARVVGGDRLAMVVQQYETDPYATPTISRSFAVTDAWQTYTATLDTFGQDPPPFPGASHDPTDPNFEFKFHMFEDAFGNDAGLNAIYVDNVRFEVVPEPGSALLLASGGLTLLRRHRGTRAAKPLH